MKKTIKIIELINNVADNIENPKIIEYDGYVWKRDKSGDYIKDNGKFLFDEWICYTEKSLNDYAEIIQDKPEEPESIQPIKKLDEFSGDGKELVCLLRNRMNEVIEAVNSLLGWDENENN